jgi:hypothetical protein
MKRHVQQEIIMFIDQSFYKYLFSVLGVMLGLALSSAMAEPVLVVHPENISDVRKPTLGPGAQWLSNSNPRFDDKYGMMNLGGKDHSGVIYKPVSIPGQEVAIEMIFRPGIGFNGWMDGHLISLLDEQGRVACQLEMVRRGRFRLTCGEKAAVSPMIQWNNNWKDGADPRSLKIIWNGEKIWLEVKGETWLALTQVPAFAPGKYQLRIGRLQDGTFGAIGWFNDWQVVSNNEKSSPAPAVDLAKQDSRFVELLALDHRLIPGKEDMPVGIPTQVNTKLARKAAARIALDALWYRTYGKKETYQKEFIGELKKMADEIEKDTQSAQVIPLPAPIAGGRWMLDGDDQYYFGSCGWELGNDVPEFAQMGYNLISINVWPEAIFDQNGKMDLWYVERSVIPNLDLAAKYGIKVDILVAPFTPQYLLKKHPEWDGKVTGYGMVGDTNTEKQTERQGRLAGHGFLKASIISPDYVEMSQRFFAAFMPVLKGHPALAGYGLANEPQFEDYTPAFQDRFKKYLSEKYGTIEALNKAWGTKHESFKSILITRTEAYDYKNVKRYWDWVAFNRMIGSEHYATLQKFVRRYDSSTPTHIKTLPYEFGLPWYEEHSASRDNYEYADGIDRLNFIRTTELAGTDSWADNWHPVGPIAGHLASSTIYQSMGFELIGQYAGGKPIVDSEYHILSCEPPTSPLAYVDMAMQINAAEGLRAGALWLTSPMIDQPIDLASNAPLLLQCGLTSAKIRHLHKQFYAISERPRTIGLLFSARAKYVQGDSYILPLIRLFEISRYTGQGVRILDERELIDGQVGDVKGIISIDCEYTLPETPAALEKFARAGGTVLLMGDFATRNDVVPDFKHLANIRKVPATREFETLYRAYLEMGAAIGENRPVRVLGVDGKPIEGVEWFARKLTNGNIVIFAANMCKTPVTIQISGMGNLYDLAAEKKVSPKQELPVWGVFVGEFRAQ